jgi:hypothetical protein
MQFTPRHAARTREAHLPPGGRRAAGMCRLGRLSSVVRRLLQASELFAVSLLAVGAATACHRTAPTAPEALAPSFRTVFSCQEAATPFEIATEVISNEEFNRVLFGRCRSSEVGADPAAVNFREERVVIVPTEQPGSCYSNQVWTVEDAGRKTLITVRQEFHTPCFCLLWHLDGFEVIVVKDAAGEYFWSETQRVEVPCELSGGK